MLLSLVSLVSLGLWRWTDDDQWAWEETGQGTIWALPPTVVSLCSSVGMQMSFLLHNLTLIYSGNIYIYTICYSALTLVYTIFDERVTMTNKLCSPVQNHFLLYFVVLAKILQY